VIDSHETSVWKKHSMLSNIQNVADLNCGVKFQEKVTVKRVFANQLQNYRMQQFAY